MWVRILSTILLMVAVGATVRADDKPIDRAELDKRIVKIVYESALYGTDIFNKGKYDQCFGLYQGTLMAVMPLLDHRVKLQASVQVKLDKAKTMKATEGAFVLREALDEIQNEIAPGAKKTTLWDRLGGEANVRKMVQDFLLTAIEDKKANLTKDGKVKVDAKALEQALVEIISVNTGGPLKYAGKDVWPLHGGMKITPGEFDATLAAIETSLKKVKVAEADIKELMAILESARKLVVENKN